MEKKPDLDKGFKDFNSIENMNKMLEEVRDIDYIRVPYKQNKVVIFNSKLYHVTDKLDFKPGYKTVELMLHIYTSNKYNLKSSLKKNFKPYNRSMSELKPKNAKFSLGQIVYHTKFKYRGVIVDADPNFQEQMNGMNLVPKSKPDKNKPMVPCPCPWTG